MAGFAVDPQVPGRLLALGNLDDFGIATSVAGGGGLYTLTRTDR